MSVDTQWVGDAVDGILKAIGEDPTREGLRDTPKRVARFWEEFIDYDPGKVDVTFESVGTDQMVVVTGLRTWSLCEHHLLPIDCKISIGYVTRDVVPGLSKLARIAHLYSHRLQIQERLTHQIADRVEELTQSPDAAVLITGVHLCMVMRGIKTSGKMITSVMRGAFRDEAETRAEFLRLVALGKE